MSNIFFKLAYTVSKRLEQPLYKVICTAVQHNSTRSSTSVLRPFYLAVHPDFLWQHPEKKEVNETSLKQLNNYLARLERNESCDIPTTLQFYIRRTNNDQDHPLVNITLDNQNIQLTIQNILSSCNIPISPTASLQQDVINQNSYDDIYEKRFPFYKKLPYIQEEKLKINVSKAKGADLVSFLSQNSRKVHNRMRSFNKFHRETIQLCTELKEQLKIRDIIWHNQWDPLIHRNCVLNFDILSKQFKTSMDTLAGRIIVFDEETGTRLDGCISFGCCDYNLLWVNFLEKVSEENALLLQIRKRELELMERLKGTNISYGHLTCIVDFGKHLFWIEKLISLLDQRFYDLSLLEQLSNNDLRIIIDCNSKEMKLLDTGEIIVSSKLQPSEILSFLKENSACAANNSKFYIREVAKESEVQEKCARILKLGSLFKDDELSRENFINSCTKLMKHHEHLLSVTQNLNICITKYYKVLKNGIVCIPWNWKCYKN